MKIVFDQITEDGLNVQLDGISWLPPKIDFEMPFSATAFCRKHPTGNIIVEGYYQAVAILTCDRCLAEFRLPLEVSFTVYVELQQDESAQEIDRHCKRAEMDTIYVDKPELDLSYLFQQQVLLSLPMKRICAEDCRGLCAKCGVNLNLYPEKCQCHEGEDSPFSILARLKKDE
ncbi:MAG: YceD family protein [Desulfurivibrionaceae bacterium]